MDVRYDACEASSPLRQGEILENCLEVIPATSEMQELSAVTKTVPVYPVHYPFAVVVTQDCDLSQDWEARQASQQDESKLLTHIHFCELFEENEIRSSRGLKADLWRKAKNNQDERYHHFGEALISGSDEAMPHLYADFKRTFSLPADYTYWLISRGVSTRRAVLRNIYCLDLIHRLHCFMSRIAVPEKAVVGERGG